MIILTTTTLTMTLGGTSVSPLTVVGSYVDLSDSTYSPNPITAISNGTTPVTLVGSPDVNYARQIKYLSIANPNVAVALVNLFHGTVQLLSVSLSSGSTLIYSDGRGFATIDSSGQTLTAVASNAAVNYTQTGLISFSRGANAPFAVNAGALVVPNLDADKVDGLHAASFPTLVGGFVPVAQGGTNNGTTLNNNRIIVSAAGAIGEAGALTNGQLLIGSTSAAPVVAALTAGNGIGVTNGAGSIAIASNSYILDRQVTLQTVTNTVATTAVYTFSVPGGTLGTNKTLHISGIGDLLNNSGSVRNMSISIKYGATFVCNVGYLSVPSSANRNPLIFDVEITAANSTSAQRSKSSTWMGNNGAVSGTSNNVTSGVSIGDTAFMINNSIAEDSTAAKSIVVSYNISFNEVTSDMRLHTIYTELK